MKVVREPTSAGDCFHVYVDHDDLYELGAMAAFLRARCLEFTVGGTADDRSRLLTVGPLVNGQEVVFLQTWSSFLLTGSDR